MDHVMIIIMRFSNRNLFPNNSLTTKGDVDTRQLSGGQLYDYVTVQ